LIPKLEAAPYEGFDPGRALKGSCLMEREALVAGSSSQELKAPGKLRLVHSPAGFLFHRRHEGAIARSALGNPAVPALSSLFEQALGSALDELAAAETATGEEVPDDSPLAGRMETVREELLELILREVPHRCCLSLDTSYGVTSAPVPFLLRILDEEQALRPCRFGTA
jgi:hypothetical protein